MDNFIEYLRTVYSEINTHLREQDKKRDQMISFYITILSIFMTFYNSHKNIHILIIMVIFGAITTIIIANLKCWHMQYVNCLLLLNYIFSKIDKYKSIQQITSDMQRLLVNNKPQKNFLKSFKSFFKSTETKVYIGMLIITSIPLYLLLMQLLKQLPNYTKFIPLPLYIIVLIIILLYIIIMCLYLYKKIKTVQNKITWVLNFNKFK